MELIQELKRIDSFTLKLAVAHFGDHRLLLPQVWYGDPIERRHNRQVVTARQPESQSPDFAGSMRWPYLGEASAARFRNGLNMSMGTGRNVVVLCSLEISRMV